MGPRRRPRGSERPRRSARFAGLGLATVVLLVSATRAVAQSVDGYVELNATHTEETSKVTDSPETKTVADPLIRRVSLIYSQPLWPNLNLQAGGFFEKTTSSGEQSGEPFDVRLTRLRPFATLRLFTPLFQAEIGVDRNESTTATSEFESKVIRERQTASVGWFPSSSTFAQLLAFKIREQDPSRNVLDREERTVAVTAQYRPVPWIGFRYEGLFERAEDRVEESEQSTETNGARISFSKSFWDRRLSIDSNYRADRRHTNFRSTSDAEAFVQLAPVSGRASIDDLPDRGALAPNPLLIDHDRASPAGINLGYEPPPADAGKRNLGVEFGGATEVRRFRVWVDPGPGHPQLPLAIAASFTWEIWTSDDNEEWVFRTAIPNAPYDTFENHFDLTFGGLTARFLKVVTRPLEPTVPLASEYPLIQVTELEAFAAAREGEETVHGDQFTLNARVKLVESVGLYYDLNYFYNSSTGSESRTFIVNGLSLAHDLSPVWSVAARIANERDDGSTSQRNADVYSASLTAVPLPALRSSVVVGGRRETIDGERRDSDSVLFNASATPYRGIDLNAGIGRAWQLEEDGRLTESMMVDVGAQLAPNPYFTLNLIYDDNSRTETGAGRPDLDDPNKALEIGATFTPVPTLYLYASRRIEDRRGTGRQSLRNVNVSWSPFPRGSLRFSFYYNEYYESEFDSLTRLGGPSVRWNLSKKSYLNVGYERSQNDSDLQHLDRSVYFGTLRIGF